MTTIRPADRYADGRESRRLLLVLADDALSVTDAAQRAAKDVDQTRALICALRRQGKVRVVRREWRPIPHRDGHIRRRCVAYYRAYNSSQFPRPSATLGSDGSRPGT